MNIIPGFVLPIQLDKDKDGIGKPPEMAEMGDAGMDIYASAIIKEDEFQIWYDTHLRMAIPVGYFGDLRPRSSLTKYGLVLQNSPGTIDPGYRGRIQFRFAKLFGSISRCYEVGDKVGQLIIIQNLPVHRIDVYESLEETERGEGGFGSTGA